MNESFPKRILQLKTFAKLKMVATGSTGHDNPKQRWAEWRSRSPTWKVRFESKLGQPCTRPYCIAILAAERGLEALLETPEVPNEMLLISNCCHSISSMAPDHHHHHHQPWILDSPYWFLQASSMSGEAFGDRSKP